MYVIQYQKVKRGCLKWFVPADRHSSMASLVENAKRFPTREAAEAARAKLRWADEFAVIEVAG